MDIANILAASNILELSCGWCYYNADHVNYFKYWILPIYCWSLVYYYKVVAVANILLASPHGLAAWLLPLESWESSGSYNGGPLLTHIIADL